MVVEVVSACSWIAQHCAQYGRFFCIFGSLFLFMMSLHSLDSHNMFDDFSIHVIIKLVRMNYVT